MGLVNNFFFFLVDLTDSSIGHIEPLIDKKSIKKKTHYVKDIVLNLTVKFFRNVHETRHYFRANLTKYLMSFWNPNREFTFPFKKTDK